jgi:zinc protease
MYRLPTNHASTYNVDASLAQSGEVIEHVLGNGLKVLTREVHAAPVATCYIWYKVGARNERPGITGISHWVEHMLFKGTSSLPKEELKRVIERNGGQWNGFTDSDYTAYFETLPSEKIDLALRLEADRMRNSIFDRDEVGTERTVILSEREGGENHPQFLLREEVQASAYKAHPYRWGVIGWKSDLQSITRDDLYDYYKAHYAPNNATLVLVGDFSTEDILGKVHEYFEGISAGEPVRNPTTIEPEQLGERRVTVKKEGNVAHVYIAYHVPSISDADIYPLDVLSMVLSSGRSSRLYRALVDKQLATYASFYADKSKDPGLAWLNAEVRAGVEPEKVEAALLAEIEKIQSEPVTDSELSRAINQAEARFIYDQDSVSKQASRIGYYESLISYRYLDTYLPNIREVSREAVQNVAQKHLTADNRTVGLFLPIPPGEAKKASGNPPPVHNQPRYYRSIDRGAAEKDNQPAGSLDKPEREVLENGLVVVVQEGKSRWAV